MMSKIPNSINSVDDQEIDKEILRAAIVAELDAVSLYEQLAANAISDNISRVLIDVIKEEKTHIGEFQAMLLSIDEEQVRELENGKTEVEELI